MKPSSRSANLALCAAFLVVVACFLTSAMYAQHSTSLMRSSAEEIARNALPSLRHLGEVRSELRRIERLAERHGGPQRLALDHVLRQLHAARGQIAEEVAAYERLMTFPGERRLYGELAMDLQGLDAALREMDRLLDEGERPEAEAVLADRALPSVRRATSLVDQMIDTNADGAEALARGIEVRWLSTRRTAFFLDGISTALAVAATLLVMRAFRHYTEVSRRYHLLEQKRAVELELFADRVAHDILGPVGGAALAIQLLSRYAPPDESLRNVTQRGLSCVHRVKAITSGLLAFAKAGARPEPGAVASVQEVVAGVADMLQPELAEAKIELVADPAPGLAVACGPGLLTSILSNLIHNAVKYMGEAPERRIRVRAEARGEAVHVEVEDTGPGLQPDLAEKVFEPHVRGEDTGQPGLGLGLATVRRICDAHGGRVGVRSQPGKGAVFWFELPAPRPPAAPQPTETPLPA